jgi:hypothetical protein
MAYLGFSTWVLWAGGLDHLCHLAQCKAKLNVAFQFSALKSASAFLVGVGQTGSI